MPNTTMRRHSHMATRLWETVDNTVGQDISFSCPVREVHFHIYTAGGTTQSTNFKVTAISGVGGEAHSDAVTVTENPWKVEFAQARLGSLFNIMASSGNIDIHAVIFW